MTNEPNVEPIDQRDIAAFYGMITPPPTPFTDRNGRIICFHDLLEGGLIDKVYYHVITDPTLGYCLLPIYEWKKEKLTPQLAHTLTIING